MNRYGQLFAVIVLLLQFNTGSAIADSGNGTIFDVNFPAEDYGIDRASFELWLPDSILNDHPIRFVITCPDYQADSEIFDDPLWRQFATKHVAAILRHDLRATLNGVSGRLANGEGAVDAIGDALKIFSDKTGHPELASAPFILTGLSQGSAQVVRLATLMPERVVAGVGYHGGDVPLFDRRQAVHDVPILFPEAQWDRFDLARRSLGAIESASELRPMWAVCLRPQLLHHQLGDPGFILLWLDVIIEKRLQTGGDKTSTLLQLDWSEGWMGRHDFDWELKPIDIEIEAVERIHSDEVFHHWFPSEVVARAWSKSLRTGLPGAHEQAEEVASQIHPIQGDLVIDGDLTEWHDHMQLARWPAMILPSGANWHGPEDLDVSYALGHKDGDLYIAIDVRDDELQFRGALPWQNNQDGLELRLDARPVIQRFANRGVNDGKDYLFLGLGPGNENVDLRVHQPERLPEGFRYAVSQDGKGYRAEVLVPKGYLDHQQKQPWKRVRMNFAINDSDTGQPDTKNWWRPDWRTQFDQFGSGTIERIQ